MLTKADCVLPLDTARYKRVLNAILDVRVDCFSDGGDLRDLLLDGIKGLREYTDEELVAEATELFGDDWEDS